MADRIGSAESVLEIGHRLAAPPSGRLVETAFAAEIAGQGALFHHLGLVDLAHTLTLREHGVIPADAGRDLVAALLALQSDPSFAARAAHGDLYTNREAYLARATPAAGWFGAMRARREALTTAYHLLVCERVIDLGAALVEHGRSLTRTSLAHAGDLMPDYTYLQVAQPTTFGHYLLGFSWPVLRDLERLASLYARVDLCPAGCGSSNGSVAFQDRAALARQLGAAGAVPHARDAMWQADLAIEAMSAVVAAIIGLDRLAEDLMIFATAEFGFIRLSDRHARASKIMPQKRNPFALSYIRSLANRQIGEQAGVAASGRTPTGQMDSRMLPYEAVPAALRSVTEAAALMAEVVSDLTFDASRGRAAIADGMAAASDLAERLSLGIGLDFRRAHGLVAKMVTSLDAEGRTLSELTEAELSQACATTDPSLPPIPEGLLHAALDPEAAVRARRDIGGAAPDEVRRQAGELDEAFLRQSQRLASARQERAMAEERLLAEAHALAMERSA